MRVMITAMRETVNNSQQVYDKKLSKLQKAILRKLDESDKFWGLRVDLLSWELARELENGSNNIENRKEWRQRRRNEEARRFKKGEINCEALNMMLYFMRDGNKKDETLTAKWRASFSRSLTRLQDRGFIYRVVEMKIEKRNGKSFWVAYVGDGRTKRVVLEPEGRKWIDENQELFTVN